MGLLTGFKDNVGEWLFRVAFKRVAAALVSLVIGFLASEKAVPLLQQWGVSYDAAVLKESLTAFITAAGVGIHDWLRMKFNFKWL